ncbi:hypothetical protein [Clostridium paraputrificum]|uniref:Uncharacterized protein n=1 Tax=Clostridium paraputrificum TaxID=29363 RepID=A0A6N3F5L1_9CLOT
MNIFILDEDVEKCARYHCNKHLVKMLVEYAQILSTTNRICGLDEGYRAVFVNHPCTVWARQCFDNWYVVKLLANELNKELIYRGFRHHSSIDVINSLSNPPLPILGKITKPYQAMPSKYKQDDYVQAYRDYYIGEKQHIADWGKRGMPYWFVRK